MKSRKMLVRIDIGEFVQELGKADLDYLRACINERSRELEEFQLTEEEEFEAINHSNKIEAIKMVRERLNINLCNAKNLVESYMNKN